MSASDRRPDQAGMTPEQSAEAVAFYRTLGKADGYTTDAATYPGVVDLIAPFSPPGVTTGPAATTASGW